MEKLVLNIITTTTLAACQPGGSAPPRLRARRSRQAPKLNRSAKLKLEKTLDIAAAF